MPKCIVSGCKSGYLTCKEKRHFFRNMKVDMNKQWAEAVGRHVLTKHQFICDKHFRPEDIVYEKQFFDQQGNVIATAPYLFPKVKPDAVPTLLLTKKQTNQTNETNSPSCSGNQPSNQAPGDQGNRLMKDAVPTIIDLIDVNPIKDQLQNKINLPEERMEVDEHNYCVSEVNVDVNSRINLPEKCTKVGENNYCVSEVNVDVNNFRINLPEKRVKVYGKNYCESEETKCSDCKRELSFSEAFLKNDGELVCEKCADLLSTTNKQHTSLPPTILDVLVCSECKNYLNYGPVHLRKNGEAICGRCPKPSGLLIRNEQYEALASLFNFPCRFTKFGCQETVPYCKNSQDTHHEDVCPYQKENIPYQKENCPMEIAAKCPWTGKSSAILNHCKEKHSDRFVKSPHNFSADDKTPGCFILSAFKLLFLLHAKVCLDTKKIYHTVQLLSEMNKNVHTKYKYILNIAKGGRSFTTQGQVITHDEFNYSQRNYLIISICDLEKAIGSYKNATFTINLVQMQDPKSFLNSNVNQSYSCIK